MTGEAWCIVVAVTAASLIWLVLHLWNNQGMRQNGRLPPGSMGLPIIGETLEYYNHFSAKNPESLLANRRKKYGDIFKTHLFGSPVIVSLDAEVNRYILLNEGKIFQSNFPRTVADMLGKWALHNIHGDIHKRIYGMVVNFTKMDRLRDHFLGDMDAYARSVLSEWIGRDVLINLEAKHYTILLASKHLLGFPVGRDANAVAENYTKIFEGLLTAPIRLPGTAHYRGLQARKRMIQLVTRVIDERRSDKEAKHDDFIGRLLSDDCSFSTEQITDFILHLLFAGHETSGSNLALAIKYLTDTPKALEQLRAEHDMIRMDKKKDEPLTWDDYKKMTFSQDVVVESLRLTNITAALLRKAMKDVEVKGFIFPKGWTVVAATRPAHLDENFFPDPFAFNPWRWQGKNYKAEPHFMPFGAGPRYCAGSEFAKLEIIVFLHYLVTNYSWEPTMKDTVKYHPLVHMRHGFPARIKAR